MSGNITGLLRFFALNIANCSRRYAAFWPARLGHSGLALLPFGPWHATHTAALAAPASAEPVTAAGSLAVATCTMDKATQAKTPARPLENLLSIMVLRAPRKAADCTLAPVQFPNVRFLLSVASAAQFPEDSGREVAFAGRSNAGKSSAINAIMARNGLARTSKTPGRTRLLNFFEVEPGQRIVDLPGYGYATAPPPERKQWTDLINTLPQRECLSGLFLIIDIRRG